MHMKKYLSFIVIVILTTTLSTFINLMISSPKNANAASFKISNLDCSTNKVASPANFTSTSELTVVYTNLRQYFYASPKPVECEPGSVMTGVTLGFVGTTGASVIAVAAKCCKLN